MLTQTRVQQSHHAVLNYWQNSFCLMCVSQVPLKVAVSCGKSWGFMSELNIPPSSPSPLWVLLSFVLSLSLTTTPLYQLCSPFTVPHIFFFLRLLAVSWNVLLSVSCSILSSHNLPPLVLHPHCYGNRQLQLPPAPSFLPLLTLWKIRDSLSSFSGLTLR